MEFNLKSTATTTLIFMTPGVPQLENGFCAHYAQCALYSVHRCSVKTIISGSDAIFIGEQVGDQNECQPDEATGGWLQAECSDWGIAVRWYIGSCDALLQSW
jgi:hypothetical protein